jgi:hypothetical protein
MAIERRLGTEENPDIIDQGKSIEIEAEAPTFDEQLMEALEVTISEDGITIGEEEVEEQEEIPFDANLVEYLDNNILGSISKKLIDNVDSDKESRKTG